MSLTKRVVDQVQPGPKPVFVWHNELRGFGLRVEPTGAECFLLRYRLRDADPGGLKRFYTTGRSGPLTADQARDAASGRRSHPKPTFRMAPQAVAGLLPASGR